MPKQFDWRLWSEGEIDRRVALLLKFPAQQRQNRTLRANTDSMLAWVRAYPTLPSNVVTAANEANALVSQAEATEVNCYDELQDAIASATADGAIGRLNGLGALPQILAITSAIAIPVVGGILGCYIAHAWFNRQEVLIRAQADAQIRIADAQALRSQMVKYWETHPNERPTPINPLPTESGFDKAINFGTLALIVVGGMFAINALKGLRK